VSQNPYCKYVLQPRHAINPEKCQKLSIATSDVVLAAHTYSAAGQSIGLCRSLG
jgi:hypothetical protein